MHVSFRVLELSLLLLFKVSQELFKQIKICDPDRANNIECIEAHGSLKKLPGYQVEMPDRHCKVLIVGNVNLDMEVDTFHSGC
jgi:hypothetical protein